MRVLGISSSIRLSLLGAVIVTAACSSDSISGPLVVLTNTWRNEANANHTFSFQDDTNGTPRNAGTFTGTETTPTFQEFEFEGFWRSDGRIEFTVHRATNVTYTGTLTSNTNRMQLTSSAGHLVLVRN